MKVRTVITLSSLGCVGLLAAAAGDFHSDLIESGYVHAPLRLDRENSIESKYAAKKVLADTTVDIAKGWRHDGIGSVNAGPAGALMAYPTSTGKRARGSAGDEDYCLYGHSVATYSLGGVNLEKYNRIAVDITPICPGMRVMNLNLYMANDAAPKDGYNQPTGDHLINLREGELNRCYLEIADLQRDNVRNLRFSASLNGRDQTTGDSAKFLISDIRFEQVEKPEKISGWQPADDAIIYSMTGYNAGGRKTAIVSEDLVKSAPSFTVVNIATNQPALQGKVRTVTTTTGKYGEIDFSELSEPGEYMIVLDDSHRTRPFRIGDDSIWDDSQWRVVNYIYGQRCGDNIPGIHGRCHTDLFAEHNGVRICYAGGWHDAGDLSQQTLQTGDVAYSLLEASQAVKKSNPALSARLREEALWGLDFALRCRFGDGYRASSMGLLHWTDGKLDDFDDIKSVRVQKVGLDGFLYAAYFAYAARVLKDFDPSLALYLEKVAKEEFDFGTEEFARTGLSNWRTEMEHTYNTSMSQAQANISWAASQLYALTHDEKYAEKAADALAYVLDCQQTTPITKKYPFSGFFYRDKDKKVPVHYIHQSREQSYMQALEAALTYQPDHPDRDKWLNAVKLYGKYIKDIMPYTAPYGMIPSGVYVNDEYKDQDSFSHLHLWPPQNANELFDEQLRQGVKLSDKYYLKRFPVWFSIFNGNTAVHSSMGKSAAIAGKILNDPELTDIAREQLYWTVGKNPFGQSLIYGEGHNYPMMNSFSSGEITGEMPVGIRTIGNTDEPFWPNINNACYKEVWVTSAGKWLSILATLNSNR